MTIIQRSLMMKELIQVKAKEYKEVKEKCRERICKGRFKDKTTAEREHMFTGTFSFAQQMEGSTTDGKYIDPATFSSAAASATVGAAAGASTSDTNLKEEHICEGYETDEMKSIYDEDSDNEGYYGGQLLFAVSQDGNNSFYVIAYGIVNVENKENWIWFLENLVNDLGDPVEKGFTFISDKQKGLDSALELVCHGAPHRYCCRHIFANFIKKFSNTLEYERAFWACAKATTQRHFAEAMMVFDRLNKDAAKWLNDIPADRWSSYNSKGRRDGFDVTKDQTDVTEDRIDVTRDEFDVLRDELDVTKDEFNVPRDEFDVTRDEFDVTKDEFDVTRDKIDETRDELDVTRDEFNMIRDESDVTFFSGTQMMQLA
ncbi:hypothetical protein CRG98_010002 [Punica granatum]|uniref:MULE transposase domain-containing protein n=1 Tax=Punica granatum TaxID=22663 RepID=A0A2I0KMB7_PUNGR|nr:hypothetical protein CRG98_010002 [Punica granatum]